MTCPPSQLAIAYLLLPPLSDFSYSVSNTVEAKCRHPDLLATLELIFYLSFLPFLLLDDGGRRRYHNFLDPLGYSRWTLELSLVPC